MLIKYYSTVKPFTEGIFHGGLFTNKWVLTHSLP